MQHELSGERGARRDLKLGRGGLLDIEFATQWLQMRHGHDAGVRTTDTLLALAALRQAGYLEPEAYTTLRDGYRFLRRLEQRVHVRRGQGGAVLDPASPDLTQLARRMGLRARPARSSGELTLGPAEQLMRDYERVTLGVRRVYLAALGLQPESEPPGALSGETKV